MQTAGSGSGSGSAGGTGSGSGTGTSGAGAIPAGAGGPNTGRAPARIGAREVARQVDADSDDEIEGVAQFREVRPSANEFPQEADHAEENENDEYIAKRRAEREEEEKERQKAAEAASKEPGHKPAAKKKSGRKR